MHTNRRAICTVDDARQLIEDAGINSFIVDGVEHKTGFALFLFYLARSVSLRDIHALKDFYVDECAPGALSDELRQAATGLAMAT